MTLAQLKTKANTKLGEFWDLLLPKQEAYFLKHGKMFGFNWTPTLEVVDGVDTDLGDIQRPSRKHHAVDVSLPTSTKVPFQIQVIRHHGTEHGFTAHVRVKLPDGRKFTRNRTAYPVVVEATYDNTDIDNPIELTPKSVSDWTITTSAWTEIIEQI